MKDTVTISISEFLSLKMDASRISKIEMALEGVVIKHTPTVKENTTNGFSGGDAYIDNEEYELRNILMKIKTAKGVIS